VRPEGTVLAAVLLRVHSNSSVSLVTGIVACGAAQGLSDRSGYLGPTFSFIHVLRLSAEDLWRSGYLEPVKRNASTSPTYSPHSYFHAQVYSSLWML